MPNADDVNRSDTRLAYQSVEPPPPRRVTLIDTQDSCRLVLPPPSPWLVWFHIGGAALSGGVQLYFAMRFTQSLLSMANRLPPHEVWKFLLPILAPMVLAAVVWLAIAALQLLHYCKYGRVPRTLEVDALGLSYRHQGFLGVRTRHWSAAQIQRVEARPLTSLRPRTPVVELICHVPSWIKPRICLGGHEPVAMGEQFARRSADFLNKSATSPHLISPAATITKT